MKGIIIVLGSMNDKRGNLSPNSRNRLDRAILELGKFQPKADRPMVEKKHPDYRILLTGGFGKHFNTTNKPHYIYTEKYLLGKNIDKKDIIAEKVKSSNTVEDAYLSLPILKKYKPKKVIVSTSNFHLNRAKFVFEKILGNEYQIIMAGSEEDTPKEILGTLVAHNNKSLKLMKENGIYIEINNKKKFLWEPKK